MAARSLTLRLAALFAAAAAIALLALGQVIGSAVDRHFQDMDREDLAGKLELTRAALARLREPPDLDGLPGFLDDALVGHHGLSVLITTAEGERLFATSGADFPALPETVAAAPVGAIPPLLTWSRGRTTWRGLNAALPTGIPGMAPVQVLVAQDIRHHEQFMDEFRATLWLTVALALALIALLGWFAARRGLLPLRHMAEVAESISADRLHERMRTDTLPKELVGLAEAFNRMFTRLEDSFRRLSDFSSDLAHELRTPVSNLVTQTQVALSRTRSADEYREVLYSSLEEYDRLSRMIADMLFLAKADNGLVVPSRESVDLAREVAQLFEFYEALAEEKGVRLVARGQATVRGDHLMLRRALGNLLSNAIRHTPTGGAVEVALENNVQGRVRISVENPGETIPPEHLPRLFDRFYRVDPSRQRSSEGVGLGLAITRSLVEAHGGSISAESADGRTRFMMELPST